MTERDQKILKSIIDIYTKTASPVGSKVLSDDKSFSVSPATIRNAMTELERDGYIAQPHTSAGRIPTILGYRYYLDNLLDIKSVNQKEAEELKDLCVKDPRSMAKSLAEKTNLAAIVGFDANDLYFTGLFNLFSQPEFEDYRMVLSMSQVVDSLEKAFAQIYDKIEGPQVLLGPDNPFSEHCSVIATTLPKEKNLLAILGPIRMDYSRILGLFNELTKPAIGGVNK